MSETTQEIWPSPWHTFNDITKIECRQLTEDTFQLRSQTHVITVNKEGFNLYRDDTPQGQVIFEDWCDRHEVRSVIRDDLEDSPEALDDES